MKLTKLELKMLQNGLGVVNVRFAGDRDCCADMARSGEGSEELRP
jgi:hypothetical protein